MNLSRLLRLSMLIAVVEMLIAASAQALPRDRIAGRHMARYDRRHGQAWRAPIDRATGRAVSRARWRGFYALPRGAVVYRYGGYSYYRAGGVYYYPYVYGGRTVYVNVNVVNGRPAPPPPAGSINIYF
jgi:hypothetical protein